MKKIIKQFLTPYFLLSFAIFLLIVTLMAFGVDEGNTSVLNSIISLIVSISLVLGVIPFLLSKSKRQLAEILNLGIPFVFLTFTISVFALLIFMFNLPNLFYDTNNGEIFFILFLCAFTTYLMNSLI